MGPVHAEAVKNAEYAELYGVCDTDEKRTAGYDCKKFTSYDDAVADENIDCIHICTPHYLHVPMLRRAVEAGKMVVVEKPAAMNYDEFKTILPYAKKTRICAVLQNRFNPCVEKLKEITESGEYGRVLGLKGILTWKRDKAYYQSGAWRGKWATEGGGLVINQALHTLDLLYYLGNKPTAVKASADTRVLGDIIEVEDTAEATIFMENDVRAHFYATNNYSTNSSYDIEVHTEKAVFKYFLERLFKINGSNYEIIAEDNMKAHGKVCWGASHEKLIDNFYRAAAGGNARYTTLEDAEPIMKLLSALYESAETGKKIEIS